MYVVEMLPVHFTVITFTDIFSCASPSEISRAKLNVVAATSCTLTFKCSEGLVPDEEVVKARCGPDGEWVPDPVQHVCTPVAVQENGNEHHDPVQHNHVYTCMNIMTQYNMSAHLHVAVQENGNEDRS